MNYKFLSKTVGLLPFFLYTLCNTSIAQMDDMNMTASTKPMLPLTVKSNEATKKQLAFARAEGDAVQKALTWMEQAAGSTSGEMRAGEYKIAYALAAPEGWYEYNNNSVTWKDPTDANTHLWLFIVDGADGRVVPPLNVSVTLRDAEGKEISEKDMRFAWMPLVNGYGENFQLPVDGNYNFTVEIKPPLYRRHDPYNGDRFTKNTTAVIPVTVKNFSQLPLLSESMEQNQQYAKNAGDAYGKTLHVMYDQANDGRDTMYEDYNVVYAVEYSEGYWYSKNSNFTYLTKNEQSAKNNVHIEVGARDKLTGRFLHNLNVVATLYDQAGGKIGTHAEMFMWHPWLYHYGENWRIPKAGSYRLHVHMDPPSYRRYGKKTGNQFTKPIDLDFDNVKLKTGQK